METSFPRHPADLPPGTEVGCWTVVRHSGQGAFGVVYGVQRTGHPEDGVFALKLALHPENPRFERERELLSRLASAQVPRLYDSGWWKYGEGISFPYVVMEWVEGESLYEWGERRRLTSRQALRVLAQLARALEALHEVSGVHRDVKGDNTRVTEDGRAVLTDFGSGTYRGAFPLTWQPVPPGTPPYWSPELVSHQWGFRRPLSEHYEATPADDVYALGVTAYHLVTGEYPPCVTGPVRTKDGHFAFEVRLPRKALVGVCPELEALTRRMLASEPSARGSAGELAQALERAAETADERADRPIVRRSAVAASRAQVLLGTAYRDWAWVLGAAAAAVGLALMVLMLREFAARLSVEPAAVVAREVREGTQEAGGTAALAEAVAMAGVSTPAVVHKQRGVGLELPKEPLPGQRRPPCGKYEFEINGGCWVRSGEAVPPCGSRIYEWKSGCYVPTFDTVRSPTSENP